MRSLLDEAWDRGTGGGRLDSSAEVDALVDGVAGVVLPGLRGSAPAAVLDPRIREVLRQLWGGADLGLGELAGACGVSPSRLTHLFRQETGTSLRQYRSWVRLRSALDVLWSGLSLTDLAHGAGFADCAHFSRTIVQMLGSTPSDLRRSMVAVGARPLRSSPPGGSAHTVAQTSGSSCLALDGDLTGTLHQIGDGPGSETGT